MIKIDIGKINDFSNFNNANDGITLYIMNLLKMEYHYGLILFQLEI